MVALGVKKGRLYLLDLDERPTTSLPWFFLFE